MCVSKRPHQGNQTFRSKLLPLQQPKSTPLSRSRTAMQLWLPHSAPSSPGQINKGTIFCSLQVRAVDLSVLHGLNEKGTLPLLNICAKTSHHNVLELNAFLTAYPGLEGIYFSLGKTQVNPKDRHVFLVKHSSWT